MTENKLCLFLKQEMINCESRASGYQARKARRREMWEDDERTKKRQKTAESAEEEKNDGKNEKEKEEEIKKKETKNEVLNGLFNETVRYSVVNSYVSAITEFYAWQSERKEEPSPSLRKAKFSVILENVRRDEKRI
jgi:hypothetical protein